MNVEANRLRTFSNWPGNAAVDYNRIARAGFYYTGRSTEVQCFLCGGRISEWNYGDQVMVRHRQVDPNCPFVVNPSATCNVPLVSTNSVPLSSPSASSPSRQQTSVPSQLLAPSVSTVNSQTPRHEYRTEAQRLRSFVNWPISMIVTPESLAKAGFYYLQESDMVECAFCRGVVMKWEPGDDPDQEHRIHFPNCDFYLHRDNGGQYLRGVCSNRKDRVNYKHVLAMSPEDKVCVSPKCVDNILDKYSVACFRKRMGPAVSTEKVELGNVKLASGATSDLTELGIQAHTAPRQPKHATYEGRLRTYQGWPEGLRQTPEMLADAGFYYVGVEDQVRCFYCDGGLRNWETTDDAWTEHARWFPRCGFVALVRGQEFIKHCIDNRPPLDPSIFVGVPDNGSGDVIETPLSSVSTVSTVSPPTVFEVADPEIEELLNTAPALAALEIGLHVGRVRVAMRQKMQQTGVPYTNADQLIEDALRVQFREDEGRSDIHTPESPSGELTYLLNRIIETRAENESENQSERTNGDRESVARTIDNDGDAIMSPKCNVAAGGAGRRPSTTSNDSAVSLEEENRRLKEARLCKICMDREVGVVFLPCGHLSTCVHCAPSLKHCPMCRQEIRATVRTFLA